MINPETTDSTIAPYPVLLTQLAESTTLYLSSLPARFSANNYHMIGIQTGGLWVAKDLAQKLGYTKPIGSLNISFYRDDFKEKSIFPSVAPSLLPLNIDGANILLVDDILMSGRTVRAALNELFDYGRPASVSLAVLVDINARQLPIKPDCLGQQIDLAKNQRVKLVGPNPISIELNSPSCSKSAR